MSVLLLLSTFVIWLSSSPAAAPTDQPHGAVWPHAGLFLGGYVLLVLWLGLQERLLVRRGLVTGQYRKLRRANTLLTFAQLLIPVWFWVGVFELDWPAAVATLLGPAAAWPVELPGLLTGVAPVLLAWAGLWWVHYPAYRALREQQLLLQFDRDLPLYAPPTRGEYFVSRVRMQLLFTAVPIFTIVALRDVVGWTLTRAHVISASTASAGVVHVGATVVTFLLAPEMLRRVLATEPLPDEPLRERLALLTRRDGVRCRAVLLWHTHHTVGNAAVMGVIAGVRYVLLTDLLLESLSDDEVLAVYAHELGHVVHRHLAWYAVFLLGFWFALLGVSDPVARWIENLGVNPALLDQLMPVALVIVFVTAFGFVSRRFERQADVHAARRMQSLADDSTATLRGEQPPSDADVTRVGSYVGAAGATVFNAALRRVSEVNNIPVEPLTRFSGSFRQRVAFVIEAVTRFAGSWVHGTMASRMRYISRLSTSPALTRRFDRQMMLLKWGMALLIATAAIPPLVTLARTIRPSTNNLPLSWGTSRVSPPAAAGHLPSVALQTTQP